MTNKADEAVPRSWEDYVAIVARRRWWIVLPLFLTWLTVWGVSWLLPTTYTSDALISAEQEKVSDIYVMENVNVNLQNRLQSTTQKVLSYASLERIIDRFKLYATPPQTSGFFKPKIQLIKCEATSRSSWWERRDIEESSSPLRFITRPIPHGWHNK